MAFRNPLTRSLAEELLGVGQPDGVATLNAAGHVEQERGLRGCFLRSQTVQAIPNNVSTPLSFDTETYDSGGYANLGVSNTNIVIVEAGFFFMLGRCLWANGGGVGVRQLQLAINGVNLDRSVINTPSATAFEWQQISLMRELATNDIVTLTVVQTSGGNLNCGFTAATESFNNRLQVVRIGPPSADGL